ncbi:probable glutamate receptor [Cryptotermes secundus]|uniref:probable glutamate receptor n=1 Tax=Cryptotermes secundus TaxID=105785 RepID=UPI000CD7D473|nr:probable glutamate receptor [Cryptotermes secundus]
MADLYPDKLFNLMGKRLIMATFNYRPYSIIDLNADPPVFDGTETRIALEFCKKLNATFDFSIDAENEWGEIYENDTGNGILGAVVEDRAELGYGAIYLWSYEYQFLDYSFPYIRTGITCLAPRPEPLAGWITPLLPFTVTSWAAVWASVVASTFSLFLVTKATEKFPGRSTNIQAGTGRYASVLDCAFNALGLLVLQTPPDERRSTRNVGPNRHVLVWLTVMFLLITTSYGSGLASILTVPRFGPPIDTVPDLVASNIPWAATHPAWMFSLRESRDPLTLHVTSQFRVMKNEELRKHSFMGDTAFSIERLPAGHYAVGDYITEEAAAAKLRLMKQDLYFEFVPTVVRKGSPYISKLNKLIHRLLDSGLVLKWEEQVRW